MTRMKQRFLYLKMPIKVCYNSLGKYQILSTIKSRSSMNKTCSKCDSFKLYQRSGRIRDSFQAAYGKSICL